MTGPLAGVKIVELAAIGPAPYGVMLLADLGAEVVRVDRVPGAGGPGVNEVAMAGLSRGRRSVAVDLKQPAGVTLVRRMVADADVFVEGLRPGVVERLGLGPEELRADHDRLIYAHVSGWGREGPLADRAGHDIDYAAMVGALHSVGRADQPPPPPANYLADFAGGGTFLALGVLAALFERERSGIGQVVDTAMIDGTASLTTFLHGLMELGSWSTQRESNLLDGGAPFYDTYRCSDGGYIAVGALEPHFFTALCDGLGLDPADWPQHDRARWPALKAELQRCFAQHPRDEWERRFAGIDACVAPVLDLQEATQHPHHLARGTYTRVDGAVQPSPAPRLSRTPGEVSRPAPRVGQDTDTVLGELGLAPDEIAALRAEDVVA